MTTEPETQDAKKDDSYEQLGNLIRRMRFERSWKLSELAERSGIATSTLSKVENNLLSLTYDRLLAVARAFDMTLSEFLADTEDTQPRVPAATGRMCVQRKGEGKVFSTRYREYEYLCTKIRSKDITPLITQIKARRIEDLDGLLRHEGEEFMYVLSGKIELHTDFYDPEVLMPGDSVYIDSTMGHGCIALTDEPSFILSTMTSQGHLKSP